MCEGAEGKLFRAEEWTCAKALWLACALGNCKEAGVAGGQESRGAWHERAERWEGQMGGPCKTLANVNKILSSSLSDKPSRSYMFF